VYGTGLAYRARGVRLRSAATACHDQALPPAYFCSFSSDWHAICLRALASVGAFASIRLPVRCMPVIFVAQHLFVCSACTLRALFCWTCVALRTVSPTAPTCTCRNLPEPGPRHQHTLRAWACLQPSPAALPKPACCSGIECGASSSLLRALACRTFFGGCLLGGRRRFYVLRRVAWHSV